MFNNYDGLWGNFITRTFSEIFPEEALFKEMFQNSGIPLNIKEETLTTLFYLLYARYGNAHISSTNEDTFKYRVQSIVFMYGPTWEKRLKIQQDLRDLEPEDLMKGGIAIYNRADAPGTDLAEEKNPDGTLTYLSGQNTTLYRKSKMEAYATLASLLETDVTKEFIDKFSTLFLKIIEPYSPLWFKTEEIDDDN